MSNESNFLSHHERKRLEYLYSNFHYLNEREQLEYNYLLKKSQGAYEEAEALQPEVDATEEVQGEIAEPIGGSPLFTNHVAKKSKKKAVAATSDLPKKPRKKFASSGFSSGLLSFSCSLSVAWSSCL